MNRREDPFAYWVGLIGAILICISPILYILYLSLPD